MSVHPGFGGQSFIPEVLDKVRQARARRSTQVSQVEIEIDGGINVERRRPRPAVVDILVAGSAIFHAADPREARAPIRPAGWPRRRAVADDAQAAGRTLDLRRRS